MSYYPWINATDEEFAWLSDWLPEELRDNAYLLNKGVSVKEWFPDDVVFDLSPDKGIKLVDYFPNTDQIFVVSGRLKDVLAETGASFEFFPVKIRNHKGRIVDEPYFLANLVGSIQCVDHAQSDYVESNLIKGQVSYFKKLALKEDNIPEGTQIFRLGERLPMLLACEELALKIKRELYMEGMIFRKLEAYGKEFRNSSS